MSKLIQKGTTPAAVLANRTNGRKSKGPITEQGKAMVRAHAGKHWGRSEGIRKFMPASAKGQPTSTVCRTGSPHDGSPTLGRRRNCYK